MLPSQADGIFRFGAYEADPGSGELRKSGLRLRVQEQPFRVLLVLLERPREVVTREELRQKLWPVDTFVDFDHSLNTVINKLREALNDSAANPRFIETLARRGYRFLAPVEFVKKQTAPALRSAAPATILPPAEISQEAASPSPRSAVSVLTRLEDVPAVRRKYVRILFFLIQLMYLSFYVAALARLTRVHELLERTLGYSAWAIALLIISAVIGLPIRLYLTSAIVFDLSRLSRQFHRLFPVTFLLDELWALSPFLLAPQIGVGLALAATAALIYVPFAQRTLLLMGDRSAPDNSA
ncbi:MAG TPA: winged helix-turn-helix domain-containing protein [Candidatus Sulfotelmatobacter sp.]